MDDMLTRLEIGIAQYDKAVSDRARFRGIPGEALRYARERGELCVRALKEFTEGSTDHWPESLKDERAKRAALEAETYARQAFRGWRAYRLMRGTNG